MQYRKKPVVIEAMQLTLKNKDQVFNFIQQSAKTATWDNEGQPAIDIHTLEGTMRAQIGDYVIRGVNGEYYPCKPDIFEKTYEPVSPIDSSYDNARDKHFNK